VIVPYSNISAMADCVVELLDDPQRRANLGAAAREKVRRRFDISVTGPQIIEAIERTLASPVKSASPAV